ncbi:MAG: conjugal transfer protein TraG [Azospira oryzae]|nr:MAG: conjugal transfer protein TraG [Azospira oryzae]PZP82944.1 MAG: conjugal transfer protein TraG [Azospira oryzae]
MSENRFGALWRPLFEARAAAAWWLSALLIAVSAAPFRWAWALAAAAFGAVRAWQAAGILRTRLALGVQRLQFVGAKQLESKVSKALSSGRFWLGWGFEWKPAHTQIASEIMTRNPYDAAIPAWAPGWLLRMLAPKDTVIDAAAIGASWIHGLSPSENPVYLPIPAMAGHVLIIGTTRSGKTRLYEILVTHAIRSGAPVIVIDPKGDRDLEARMRKEASACGREFLYFHPASPSRSVRINPLKSFNHSTEIATRIAQLLPSESPGGDPFTQFAWYTINHVVQGMLMTSERPDLKRIRTYVRDGVAPLLERCMDIHFRPIYGHDWDGKLAPYLEKAPSRTHAMVSLYRDTKSRTGLGNDAIEGLVSTFEHDKEHFGKMILSLLPLLDMLCTGEIGDMLSPAHGDLDDPRDTYDMERIVYGRKVLYVGLDSLSNKIVGSAVGSMLLADLSAVAGAIYNFGNPSGSPGANNVYVFVDEAAEVVNDQFIQVLNKAGGAGFKAFIAMQTLADLEARLGKKSKSLQTLGNTNTLICLRVRDFETAEWVSDMMGKTVTKTVSISHSIGTETEASLVEFRGNVSRSMQEKQTQLVPPEIMLRLPNLQYFAVMPDGRIVKGRLPLIKDEPKAV